MNAILQCHSVGHKASADGHTAAQLRINAYLDLKGMACIISLKEKKKNAVLPQRPSLSIGSKVGFTNEEQIDGLGELIKASVQQVKLVVDVDGVDDPPRGLSGRQPLLGGQIGVVHHGGNATVRAVPSGPTHTLHQPLPVAPPASDLGFWS